MGRLNALPVRQEPQKIPKLLKRKELLDVGRDTLSNASIFSIKRDFRPVAGARRLAGFWGETTEVGIEEEMIRRSLNLSCPVGRYVIVYHITTRTPCSTRLRRLFLAT
jgi:hypothetical protein